MFLPTLINDDDKSSPLANCIRNHYRHLKKWAKRSETDCFRIYDREINHFPLAIDLYAGRFCIQNFAPSEEDSFSAIVEEVEKSLATLFDAGSDKIFWRTRVKKKETRQYEKRDNTQNFFIAHEYGLRFKINLIDYLDTGLFLDHRETRHWVGKAAQGKKVLNLFAYTCAFSVHAAAGGASFTKSVDMSNTYTAWGQDNFVLNGFSLDDHVIIREDCLKFLQTEREKYDLIIIDPPTISRSKKMEGLFDIQKDYPFLILNCLKLLEKGGVILFSTNSRKFRFDAQIFPDCFIEDISKKTLPLDFKDPLIHRCWKIMKT
jgi:23S rRNA G2069 N7-methylase RlmK/C1962 C5-methylase RlmI